MAEGPGDWVDKDAFVLSVLPPELRIDPILCALLHCAAFLELSGDETVDPDWAVEALEHVAHYLGRLSPEAIAAVQAQLEQIATYAKSQQWPSEVVDFIADFLVNCGIGDEGSGGN